MTSATTHTIVGFFATPAEAKTAVHELVQRGFSRDQISVLAADSRITAKQPDAPHIGPVEETGSQDDAGEKAAVGGMAGFVIGIAALAIPGVGPLIAAGPLAAALTGAAAGAATGGLIGALKHHGVPEERAQHYSKAIGAGRVMVSVRAEGDRVDQAADILDRSGAVDIDEPAEHIGTQRPLTQTPLRTPRFDESDSLRARQRERERRVEVHPGITGAGVDPNE